MKTPQTFYEKYNGIAVDYDHAYDVQCVDGVKVGCEYLGIPVKATPNNWANGYWIYKDQLGYAQYFDYITDVKDLKPGDWCIWDKGSSCALSHIAMYWKGVNGTHAQFFGERQDGKLYFCLANIKLDIMGALRPKAWSDVSLKINYRDFIETTYLGQKILVYGQATDDKVTLISAKTNGKVNGNDVQLIGEIDDSEHIYDAKLNANYFIMSNGVALGVRCGVNEWSVPRQNAFYYYALMKDGQSQVGMDRDFWYTNEQVQFACSPAIITLYHGSQVFYESPASSGTKTYANTQSMLIRTNKLFAFAIVVGKLTVAQCTEWAKGIEGIQDLCFMDSGGSACMQVGYNVYYSTNEHRKISNALAFYRNKTEDIQEPVTEPVTDPIEEPVEQKPTQDEKPSQNTNNEVTEPIQTGNDDYLFKMSNRAYDFLKFLTHIIPILLTFYVAISKIWNLPMAESIIATVTAFDSMLITIMNMSTIGYKQKGGQ